MTAPVMTALMMPPGASSSRERTSSRECNMVAPSLVGVKLPERKVGFVRQCTLSA
jgi:hypothetical protein